MSHSYADTGLSRTIASTATMKLAQIQTLNAFYTPLEERFDRITRLARHLLRVPVAAITLLADNKQWFKSVIGWNISELPLEQSLCNSAVDSTDLIVIADTMTDKKLAAHPLVRQRPRFRFYAGKPLLDDSGLVVGTFCVMDVKPRILSAEDVRCFEDFATMAARELFADQLAGTQAALTSKLGAARRQAMIDPLTRLWNRRGSTVLLRGAMKQAVGEKSPVALGILDVDNFKQINDVHGHLVGDEALRKVARILVANIRDNDMACRPGGDEFSVIMTNTDGPSAAQILERIRYALAKQAVPTRGGPIKITLSAGYAIHQPGESLSEKQFMERADDALRRSKDEGRNRVRMAS